MTKEEIIEMAREAGGYYSKKYPDEWRLDDDDLVRFAKLVAEKEREECAKIIDDSYTTTKAGEGISEDWLLTLSELGGCVFCGFTPKLARQAIRARGQE